MRVAVAVPFRDSGCTDRAAAWRYVSEYLAKLAYELIVVDDGGEMFSRGASLNSAFRESDADVIICCDADTLVPLDNLRHAAGVAVMGLGLVQPFDELIYCQPWSTTNILKGAGYPRRTSGQRIRVSPTTPLLGGVNVLSRETWERSGGWDERYRGWGCEDIDAARRFTSLGPLHRFRGLAVHLHHPKDGDYASLETVERNGRLLRGEE